MKAEMKELREKYEVLKQVNQLLQRQIKQQVKRIDAECQVDLLNDELRSMLQLMERSHQEEKRVLIEQVCHLEKKVQKLRAQLTVQHIQDIKNIYLNKLVVSPVVRQALEELENLICQRKEYEISDLKYKLHFAEQALKQPEVQFRHFDVEKLQSKVEQLEDDNLDALLRKLNVADQEWNALNAELLAEQQTLSTQLSSTVSNLWYEMSSIH